MVEKEGVDAMTYVCCFFMYSLADEEKSCGGSVLDPSIQWLASSICRFNKAAVVFLSKLTARRNMFHQSNLVNHSPEL